MWQNVADGGLSQTKNYHTRWFYATYQKQPSENRKHEVPKLSPFHLIPQHRRSQETGASRVC
ncbi:MAG: hypothetical protein AAGJ08_07080 [Cyanobacteria bacterium P01_H01_bin.35]